MRVSDVHTIRCMGCKTLCGGGPYTMSMNVNMNMNMNMNMNDGGAALMMPPPRSTSNKPLFSAPPPNRPVFKPSKTKTHSSVQLGARWGHTSLVVDRRLYVIGGIGNNLVHDTCVYDFDRTTWSEVHTLHTAHTSGSGSGSGSNNRSPGARYGHSTVRLPPAPLRPARVLLFGGRNTSKKYFNDMMVVDGGRYVLDTERQQWSYVASDKTFPDPRAGHSAALISHTDFPFPRLVVFGGNYHNKYLNSVYVMDVVSSEQFQWHKPSVKGTPPCPRSGHTCTPIPNTSKMLVFGGFDGKKCFNDAYIFCAVTFTWTQITPLGTPPRPRSGHTAALVADRFWVIFGGCSDAVFLNDFHILDLKTGSGSSSGESNFQWLPPPTLPLTIAPRFHHSCDTVDHSIVIFGGCASGALFNDMVALDVSPLLEMPELFPLSRSTTTDGPINLSRSTNSLLVPSTSTTTTSTSLANSTSTDSPLDTTPSSAPTPLSPLSQDIALSNEQKPEAELPLSSSSSSIAITTPSPVLSNPSRTEPLTTDTPSSPASSSPLLDPSNSPSSSPTTIPPSVQTSSDSTSSLPSSSSPPPSSPSSSLTVMHSIASYNVPGDIDLVRSSKNASKLVGFPEDPNKPSSAELCLTAALNNEQQKVKEVELYLAKEKAAHASLRADYVSEQIKVKELEERLFKTEKQLKKAQRGAAEGKTHSQIELQKAHAQIATLRSELAKKVEKHESSSSSSSSSSSDRRSHSSRQQHTQHPAPSATHEQPTQQTTTQPPVQQQLSSLLELCTPEHLDPLELPVLMQLQTSSIKASESIAAAKDKKIQQLLASIENLQIDINAKAQVCQEKEDAFNNVSNKFSQLQEEHKKEKENLRHLTGEGLENMDASALEKLEEIHHTGLRKVGMAKTQALAQQVARLQREKEELVERVVCVVCADGQINTILSPCGHRCLCKPCADLLHNCPLCRTPITSKLQYFH